ncbi:Hpt domain-containing protein [Cupriavidus sp. SW-Y-13]|uniref:Hpt domain-containing protein n=1 Tax=Cupriavidus sp. SW-Y-13 TaxID=2653854 RepID=UPI00136670FE|nr:Hpt domain-containing protein [Cupriavidus sp. SW-Y-13]MWL90688.1 Hpt domain-containing protein [Cupriavidus sp. SW-Y-13]
MTSVGARHRLPPDERDIIGAAVAHAARQDPTMQAMLVARLIETNATDLQDLRHAVTRRDWPGVRRTVHRIKGAAALARCASVIAAGKSIESAAGQGNAAVVNTLLPRYVAILGAFNDTLAALESNGLSQMVETGTMRMPFDAFDVRQPELPMQTARRTGTLSSGTDGAPRISIAAGQD